MTPQEKIARLRGQIYEAEYSLRFIPHARDCKHLHTVPCPFKRLASGGFCDRAKQDRRIVTLKAELEFLVEDARKT